MKKIAKGFNDFRGFAEIKVSLIRTKGQEVVADGVPFTAHANIKFDFNLTPDEALPTELTILLKELQKNSIVKLDKDSNSEDFQFDKFSVKGLASKTLELI